MMTLTTSQSEPVPTDTPPWPATIAYYQECKDIRQTADHFQIKIPCVYYRLKQANIPLFPARRGRPPKTDPKIKVPAKYPSRGRKHLCRADIITFYQNCKNIPQTAEHFQVQIPAIYYHLKSEGIPIIHQRRQKRAIRSVKEKSVELPNPAPSIEKSASLASSENTEKPASKKMLSRDYPDIFAFRSYPINMDIITQKIETGTLRTRPTKKRQSVE